MAVGDSVIDWDVITISAVYRESVLLLPFGRPPILVIFLTIGLNRCSTRLDLENSVDDNKGVGIETLCLERAY